MTIARNNRRDEALLSELLSAVNRARSEFREHRNPDRSNSHAASAERASRLAAAMESYAEAAVAAGIPLPYRYRDELRLYRALANGSARDRR